MLDRVFLRPLGVYGDVTLLRHGRDRQLHPGIYLVALLVRRTCLIILDSIGPHGTRRRGIAKRGRHPPTGINTGKDPVPPRILQV